MSGILSWLRKHFSAEWWRSRCQCLRGEESDSYGKKFNLPMTVQFHDMRSAELSGIDNPLFQTPDVAIERRDRSTIEVPTIEVQPPPPPDYSTLERNDDTDIRNYSYAPSYDDSLKYHRRSYRPNAQAKITSRLSITSDYVSDAESEYRHSTYRSSTNGRYSGRRTEGKKRRLRHRYSPRASSIRSYTHSPTTRNHHSTNKMRKYPTGSLTNDSSVFEPRKPISRRHSIDNPASSRAERNATNVNLSISIRRNRKPSTARGSIREAQKGIVAQRNSMSGARSKTDSFAQKTLSETPDNEKCSSNDSATLQKSSSVSPTPHKPGGLVRNETILEVPIYIKKPSRPASAHAKLTTNHTNASTRHSRQQRKPRHPKPPRSNKLQSSGREQPTRVPRSEKWLYGYASLPASWNNIEPDKLEQAGLTRESLMESLERLDLEKLCRPVPNISNEQLSTPRMSVVQTNMRGDEKEMLKDTYKLQHLDIVSTDL